MRTGDLRLDELLEFQSDGGVLRFAGQRTLLLDAAALGLLRLELVNLLGFDAARGIMTRFGYAHGWRTAEALEHALPWESVDEWRRAGGRLHRLQGMVTFEPVHESGFAEAIWRDSYEAEQHLLHFGEHEHAVCWSLCGFASGYLSRAHGRSLFCVETQCRGRGDALCRMWGDERERLIEHGHADALSYFDQHELDDALLRVRENLRKLERKLRTRRRALSDEPSEDDELGIVARSPAMRTVLDLARRFATMDVSAIITGPTGAGKERLALFIHEHSSRAGGPFVKINCGAVPEALLERELFGHGKQAGLIEAAHTGTLLLDEIGELPPRLQTHMNRFLQERAVYHEGKLHLVDVRVLASTRRDLAAEVQSERFHSALHYRLNVLQLHVPPLRERTEDVLPLARMLLASASERLRRPLAGFAPSACELLLAHDWPGNVRELQNAIEHAAALARGRVVEAEDLPRFEPRIQKEITTPTPDRTLEQVEREHILAVLEASGGNRAEAARRLGIGAATLFRRLKQWNRA